MQEMDIYMVFIQFPSSGPMPLNIHKHLILSGMDFLAYNSNSEPNDPEQRQAFTEDSRRVCNLHKVRRSAWTDSHSHLLFLWDDSSRKERPKERKNSEESHFTKRTGMRHLKKDRPQSAKTDLTWQRQTQKDLGTDKSKNMQETWGKKMKNTP